MEATLQGIFGHCFDDYAKGRKLPLRMYKAADAIKQCRTSELGGHVQRCPQGHVQHIQYNSCKHRSCPRCSELPKTRWAEAQQARLLACDHYHVIFTLPHELLALWQHNRRWFARTLFQASRETLMTLMQDESHHGVKPGLIMSLHTWGRTLSLHPHIHCLVTGGGLTKQGDWKGVKNGYLLPSRVVRALYKGRLLSLLWAALKADELCFPEAQGHAYYERLLTALKRKEWNVRIQERYPHGQGVMRYLARYVKGGALSDRRVLTANKGQVSFLYKDHRDSKRKVMALETGHFMERILWHVPIPGQHVLRHVGLYAHLSGAKRAACREQLGQPETDEVTVPMDWQAYMEKRGFKDKSVCSTCGQRMIQAGVVAKRRKGNQNSIGVRLRCNRVQQGVEVGAAGFRGSTEFIASSAAGGFFLPEQAPLN